MNDLSHLFIFLVVALAPGTAESEPSTEGLFFKVPIAADNVTGVEFGLGYTIRVHIKPSDEYQAVSVRIPKGLPVDRDSMLGYLFRNDQDKRQYDPDFSYGYYWFALSYKADRTGLGEADGERQWQTYRETARSPYAFYASEKCHTVNTAVVVANVTRVVYEYIVLASNTIPPHPHPPLVSPPIPDGCDDVVILRPPFDPPLRQVLDGGILAETVACNDGLVRHVREGGDPLCLRPETLERLLDSGVLVAPPEPPEPPEPPPPPPRGHRELPHRP